VLRTPAISVVNVGMFKKNRKKSKSKIEWRNYYFNIF
jgi:hypothetical protein